MKEIRSREYYDGIHLLQDVSIWIVRSFACLGVYFFLDRYIQEESQLFFGVFWICAVSLFTVLLRHFCHKLPLLLIGHGFFYAVVLLCARETSYLKEERTIFCLFLLTVVLIGSIQAWRMGFGHTIYFFPWYLILEIVILYFYGAYKKDPAYQMMAFTLMVVLLIGHFWCTYLQGMNDYLDQNKRLEGIPRDRIFRTNTRMIVFILIALLLVMILLGALRFDRFSGQIGGYIATFFRMLLLGIQSLVHALRWWNHGETPQESIGVDQPDVTYELESSGGDLDTSTVLPTLFVCLGIFFYLVYRLAKAFDDRDDHVWSRPEYGGYQKTDDQVESIQGEEKQRFHLFRTNREKVRYYFKKRVKKTMQGHIPVGSTAWELTEELQRQEEQEIELQPLTRLYDVARYGKREITTEEIRKIKVRKS